MTERDVRQLTAGYDCLSTPVLLAQEEGAVWRCIYRNEPARRILDRVGADCLPAALGELARITYRTGPCDR